MSKIKLTKGELKRQRDSLQQFEHYLPVLQLKKKQLQVEIQRVHEKINLKTQEIKRVEAEINEWAGLLNEPGDYISRWIKPKGLVTWASNIAGIDIPVFESLYFEILDYDLFLTPLWVDAAIEKIRSLVVLMEEERILRDQIKILEHELRITTQRVNLFEKVKIPEARDNIRLIRIYLCDQETNAIGRSKIAKNKIEGFVLEAVRV